MSTTPIMHNQEQPESRRLFFAIWPNEAASHAIFATVASLKEHGSGSGIRWQSQEKLHYTLQFLATVIPDQVASVLEAGHRAARLCSCFDLDVCGLSAFPNTRQPKTLWFGVCAGDLETTSLAVALGRELTKRDIPIEDQHFVPHLTLARIHGSE